MSNTTWLPALLLLCATLGAQQDFSAVQIKATHVAGPVHMLEGAGGNIGASIGDDGVLLIDDQFGPLADKIRAAVKELGGEELRLVLNTHWHGDHTGGNQAFGREAIIVAHENVRARMSVRGETDFGVSPPSPSHALPVVTFAESVTLHFNGEAIRVLHLPGGHTDGDSYMWFTESNVAHLGDHFFAGTFPYVDLRNGGSAIRLLGNIAGLLETLPSDIAIIPGHGPLAGIAELRAYHGMLEATIAHVRAAKSDGESLYQVQRDGLPAEWDGWGRGFITADKWIQIVYESLEAEDSTRKRRGR